MRVVSQAVVAIDRDEAVNVDWNLLLQRLELEASDVPDKPDRAGEVFDTLSLRIRGAGSGGGRIDDVTVPLDELRGYHLVDLRDDLFGVIGALPHDRYSSAHVAIYTDSGRHECRIVSNPDYAVDFFVCLALEKPTALHADIAGMDYDYPITWPS